MMTKKKKKRKLTARKIQKGSIGNFFVYAVLALLIVIAVMAIGGPPSPVAPSSDEQVIAVSPTLSANHNDLQLKWFGYITLTPTPTPGAIHACQQNDGDLLDTEIEIFQGSDPGPGGSTSNNMIRAWVKDENPPYISAHEKVDSKTGLVTPGDRAARDVPTDGKGNFFWEPSLYIIPTTQNLNTNYVYCDVNTPGCQALFPRIVKGNYNTADYFNGDQYAGSGFNGPPVDSDASYLNGPNPSAKNPNGGRKDKYLAEYIWDISTLRLTPGTYIAQFSVHDGDQNLAVDCFTISL